MNKHATALANNKINLNNLTLDDYLERNKDSLLGRLHTSFENFISEVKQFKFRKDYLKIYKAPESDAYWNFWKFHGKLMDSLG